MKKLLAILLTLAMFATMIPVLTVGVSAEAPTYNDTWANHYDLSWFTTRKEALGANDTASNFIQLTTTENEEEVTYYYQVLGCAATNYFIDTAEELAGLAKLVNSATKFDTSGVATILKNCTIYVTADITLTGKNWVPIGNTFEHCFGANVIGSKGSTAETIKATHEAVTITGMNVVVGTVSYSVGSSNYTGNANGFIGNLIGGSLENFNFVSAYVTANGMRTGGVIGQCNDSTVRNISSDAVVTLTNPNNGNGWDVAGGIIGAAYSNTGMTVSDCIFTGSIDNTKAGGDVVGGIVAVSERALTVDNCEVTSDSIKVGTTNEGSNYGCGGVVGVLRNGDKSNATFTVSNCTVDADLTDGKGRTGGIVGAIWKDNEVVTISNNSYTGTLTATKTSVAPIVGHTDTKLSLSDCENNGTVVNADSVTQLKFGQGTYTDGVVTSLSAQKSTLEGVKAVRVVAQVKADALTGAGFDFVVSYKDAETEETVTTKINSVELTKAFEAIYVDGTETAAAEGYVWVAFVLNNITADSVTISAVANATYTDSTVYGTVGSATIPLA